MMVKSHLSLLQKRIRKIDNIIINSHFNNRRYANSISLSKHVWLIVDETDKSISNNKKNECCRKKHKFTKRVTIAAYFV